MAQLALGQLIEHVALVLPPVFAPQQQPPPPLLIVAHPGIVAGSDGIRPLLQRPVQQGTEFDLPVAVDAGIGSSALHIFLHKVVHDGGAEQPAQIQHLMGNPHGGGHRFGHLNIICRTAQARPVLIGMQAQRDAGDVVPGPPQQQCRRSAVHAAAHGSKHALNRQWNPS